MGEVKPVCTARDGWLHGWMAAHASVCVSAFARKAPGAETHLQVALHRGSTHQHAAVLNKRNKSIKSIIRKVQHGPRRGHVALPPAMDPESSVPLITPSQQQASRSLSYARTTGYCLAFMSFGLEVNLMGPTIPTLARRAGVAEADMGPLFTLTGLTCLIGAFPSGYLVDRMPGHVILGVAMLLQVRAFPLSHAWSAVLMPRCPGGQAMAPSLAAAEAQRRPAASSQPHYSKNCCSLPAVLYRPWAWRSYPSATA